MESGTENSLPMAWTPDFAAEGGKVSLKKSGARVPRLLRVEEERGESPAASAGGQDQAMVKRWGKSPPRTWQQGRHAKPHPEQDQIGER
jgi:hypothetical protein